MLAAALLGGCTKPSIRKDLNTTRSAILISIDGLRPEFYLDASYQAPNLQRLKSRGSYSEGAIPVYPSSTFPNHASIVTGMRPASHGIISNTLFDFETGPSILWYWESKYLKTPPIWDVAKKSGKGVAIFGWPVSVGATADWIIPEIFSPYGINHDENWKLTLLKTDPSFMAEIRSISTVPVIRSSLDYDRWMTEAAIHVRKKHDPELTLLHFRSLDEVQHATGPFSAATREAVTHVDELLGKVLAGVDLANTLVVVVGDHGFDEVNKEIHLNAWFNKQGWIKTKGGKLSGWQVMAHPNGNQAAIYSKDMSRAPEILRSIRQLERETGVTLKIFDTQELKQMGAFPDAVFALDPQATFSFGPNLSGPVIRKLKGKRGTHGALASRDSLLTGLIVVGPDIAGNVVLPKTELIDIAPTIASRLGFTMKADGKPIFAEP